MTESTTNNEASDAPETLAPPKQLSKESLKIGDYVTALDMSLPDASKHLGVPIHTLRKWISGERAPNASAIRLIEVMGLVKTLCPDVHKHL